MINFKINPKFNNKKIVNVILSMYPNINSSVVYKALRKKDVLVNGKRVKENVPVFENDEITAYIVEPKAQDLNIVYEDDNIIVVNKPTGISVTDNKDSSKTLTNIVQSQFCKTAMPCHRLDRNTQGLVVFAKNKESLDILFEKFKNREIEKYYVCIVHGIPHSSSKTLTSYLFKDNKKSIVYVSDEPKKGSQKIITSYNILDSNKAKHISLLEVKLETGRTHQIRAHLAHIGHPIIGDGKYGINNVNKEFKEKKQLLLSYKLQFSFTTDAKHLNYLKNKTIEISYKNFENKLNA